MRLTQGDKFLSEDLELLSNLVYDDMTMRHPC